METRLVKQVKVYSLVLNSVYGRTEQRKLVAIASSEHALKEFYDSQRLEAYEKVDRYSYNFKDGALRNFNPLNRWSHVSESNYGHGWFEEWVNEDDVRNDVYKIGF